MFKINEIIFSVFVYNIIFGSGVLILPKAFWSVGYGLGVALLVLLAFISWASCVFVVESLSLTNLMKKIHRSSPTENTNLESNSNDTDSKLLSVKANPESFQIETKFEIAEMANVFFGKVMLVIFYTIMVLYLYGDLCIYLSVVGSTLKSLSCANNTLEESLIKPSCIKIGDDNIFRIYVASFFIATAPFVFFNLKKSAAVQIATMILRLAAVLMMTVFSSMRIARGAKYDIKPANLAGIPQFFGIALYSFMCQHSIPSMISTVQNKNAKFIFWMLGSMTIALAFYIMTVMTATFAFTGDEIYDVFSTNFGNEGNTLPIKICYYFLMVFPSFALTASYPIVATTLRENLISLCIIIFKNPINPFVRKLLFPMFAIVPPFILVLSLPDKVKGFADNIGTYVGSFVQYFIPACLVYYARKRVKEKVPNLDMSSNLHTFSIFNNRIAPIVVMLWTFVGIGIVTYYKIMTK